MWVFCVCRVFDPEKSLQAAPPAGLVAGVRYELTQACSEARRAQSKRGCGVLRGFSSYPVLHEPGPRWWAHSEG